MKKRTDKLAATHTRSTPQTDIHRTPKQFFDYLEKQLKVKFTIDIAASAKNALCKKFIDEKQDALKSEWTGVAWCNPPYSKAKQFVAHCRKNAESSGTTVMLMAARTDRDWWRHTKGAWAIVYIKGRLKFAGAKAGAPFPSVVIIFKKGYPGPAKNVYLAPTPYERGFSRGKPE